MTVLSQVPIRPQPFSITRAIGAENIRDPISPRGPVSCKPMPMADMASSTTRAALLRLSSKLAALPSYDGTLLVLQDTTEFVYQRSAPDSIGYTKKVNSGATRKAAGASTSFVA